MTSTTSWTPKVAKAYFAKLTKVANDLLDVAGTEPAPEDAAGTAGPQEVVDALDVIVDQLEEIQAAVPAEPAAEEGEIVDPNAAPIPEPVSEPVAEDPVPEEEPLLAKATTRIADLEKKIEAQELEKVAQTYAYLHDDTKVQQAKYNEVIASKKTSGFWVAKIEAIEEFKQNAGEKNSYKPAQNTTSWLQSRTKVAKLSSNELVRL
jgi:hypothetical protein